MTYLVQHVLAHCRDHPDQWSAIDGQLTLSPDGRYITVPVPIPGLEPAKPLDDWPLWAKVVYRLKREGESGLGDTIARLIGPERSEKFKAWFEKTVGKNCSCTKRQAWLNAHYPYDR